MGMDTNLKEILGSSVYIALKRLGTSFITMQQTTILCMVSNENTCSVIILFYCCNLKKFITGLRFKLSREFATELGFRNYLPYYYSLLGPVGSN